MIRTALILIVLHLHGCTEEPAAAPNDIGEACRTDEECLDDIECLDQMPDGLCTTSCTDVCPEGSTCVDLAGVGYCFTECEGPEDCRTGYGCSLGHCDIPCEGDQECPEFARCDDTSRGCQLREDQPLGGACLVNEQCQSDQCFIDDSRGICTEPCGGSSDCDEGLTCTLVSTEEGPRALCRQAVGAAEAGDLCDSGSDCRTGACSRGACVTPCGSEGQCEPGARCVVEDVDVEGLETVAESCWFDAAPGVRVDDLGELDTERGCLHVEFDVADDIVSFAVVAWTNDDVVLQSRNLMGPENRELVDERGAGLIRVLDRERVTTVLVPNSDLEEAAALPGHYQIDFCAQQTDGPMLVDATIHVRVLQKIREGGLCLEGRMVLNVHLAPHVYGPMTAEDAEESPYMQEIFERVRDYYEDQCSIVLEEVRFFDMDDTYALIGSENELREMFENLSVDAPHATANVFVVRDLSGIDEWVAGMAGGIPGPPGVGGTPSSGVAFMAQEESRVTGDTLAHELGHFFGLYHTTEMNGMSQDQITDTESCVFDPEDPWTMSSCATINNIMFPMLNPLIQDITEGQCLVVRGYQGV